jgi:hypothetical protein
VPSIRADCVPSLRRSQLCLGVALSLGCADTAKRQGRMDFWRPCQVLAGRGAVEAWFGTISPTWVANGIPGSRCYGNPGGSQALEALCARRERRDDGVHHGCPAPPNLVSCPPSGELARQARIQFGKVDSLPEGAPANPRPGQSPDVTPTGRLDRLPRGQHRWHEDARNRPNRLNSAVRSSHSSSRHRRALPATGAHAAAQPSHCTADRAILVRTPARGRILGRRVDFWAK